MRLPAPAPALALAAAAALGAGFAAAQQSSAQPGAQPGVFGEVLEVRVVNLEVVVTDRDGVPVRGLQPSDFLLTVDGEEVAIDYFTEVRGGVAAAGDRPQTTDLPSVPALVPGERVGTSYLVFLDEYFGLPTDRDRALRELEASLGLLGPEDRMAIVAYNGEDLEMLSTWSSSAPELERALSKTRLRPARGLGRLAERRQLEIDDELPIQSLLGELDLPGRPGFRDRLSPSERYYVQRLTEQLDRSVAAVAATLRSFAKPPGRKVLLLYSGGWPYFPAEYLAGGFNRVLLDRQGLEGDDLYRRLIDTANLLGYTIFPVDLPGLDRELLGASATTNSGLGSRLRDGVLREMELHQTLTYLARETGGEAFLDGRSREAFERTVAATRSYYWLGFSPSRAWDDERHEIEVEVRTPGYRASTRSGFLDTSRDREVTMAVESTLLFGNAPTGGELEVELGEARKAGRGKMEVPVEVVIPLDRVTFLPSAGGFAARLELRVAVIDEDGSRAEIPTVPVEIQGSGEPEAGAVARYATGLLLRRKAHDAVFAIYDAASGRILSASARIAP